jgi:hypothetical protein
MVAERMSESASTFPRPHAHSRKRGGIGARIWFAWMVSMWVAFAVLLVAAPDVVESLWSRVRDLPLVAELVFWVLFLPWMLGMAVWQSSWPGWLRLLLVLCFALGWTLASVPRHR